MCRNRGTQRVRKRLLIFDLDGTLIDDYRTICEAFNYAMRRLNRPEQSYETVKHRVGSGHRNLLSPFVSPAELERAEVFYKERYDQLFPYQARLFPGVKSLLASLRKAGYSLAAASNKIRPYSQAILSYLEIDLFFQVIVCQDDVGGRLKPDPAMLMTILEQLKQSPSATLYIGDTVVDIEAGRRAHIDTVAVLTGSDQEETLRAASPLALLPTVSALPGYLATLS